MLFFVLFLRLVMYSGMYMANLGLVFISLASRYLCSGWSMTANFTLFTTLWALLSLGIGGQHGSLNLLMCGMYVFLSVDVHCFLIIAGFSKLSFTWTSAEH